MNRRASGSIAEEIAAKFLEKRGMKIVARNKKIAGVEVDILAVDGRTVVFAEVKASDYPTSTPSEHVTPEQQRRYIRAAEAYRAERALYGTDFRFDVVEVVCGEPRYIPDAFRS